MTAFLAKWWPVFLAKSEQSLSKRVGYEAIYVPQISTSWGQRNGRGSNLERKQMNALTT